jgi:hypothetical protein
MNVKLDWLNEKVPYLPKSKWLYRIMCFLLFRMRRKFTYGDLYVFFTAFHQSKLGEKGAQKKALSTIMSLYAYFHNNEYPNIN